jgi:hypothetical protein
MSTTDVITRNLARAFLAGAWTARQLRRCGSEALGESPPWLALLVRRVVRSLVGRPTLDELVRFLATDESFVEQCHLRVRRGETLLRRVFWLAPVMDSRRGWQLPTLRTTTALAEWLRLTPGQLDWFADCQGRERRTPPGPLRHYEYRWLTTRGGKRRLLEQPRPRLKHLQRKVLHGILDHVPAHDTAHGYRPLRGIVTYATPHVGQRIVLRFDLRDFFASVRGARVRALFRTAGYPEDVARSLAGLCTNRVPAEVCEQGAGECFRRPHLPQGAPTSPALANLCAYRLDRRLAGLAAKRGARYTRYADDLAFSGGEELEGAARRFQVVVCRIALEEGFEINTRKSRFMRRGARQQLAGVVVNERLNCRRDAYDLLKATLTNCARHGPAGQNRRGVADFRAHLAGRIAQLAQLNAARGERLRALFGRIDWATGQPSP